MNSKTFIYTQEVFDACLLRRLMRVQNFIRIFHECGRRLSVRTTLNDDVRDRMAVRRADGHRIFMWFMRILFVAQMTHTFK